MAIPVAAVTAAAESLYTNTDPLAYNRIEAALAAAAPAMRVQAMLGCAEGLESCGFTEAAALVRAGAERSQGEFERKGGQ